MILIVRYNTYQLRKLTKKHSEEIETSDGINLLELVNLIQEKYGREFKNTIIDKNTGKICLHVLIDGISVNDINYKLKNKDRVNFLTMTTGG